MRISTLLLILAYQGFIVAAIKLRSTISEAKSCITTPDCIKQNLLDPHIICAKSQCRCEANYLWESENKTCLPFNCHDKEDCQEYDAHRICIQDNSNSSAGKRCECNSISFVNKIDKMCVLKISGNCAAHSDCTGMGDLNMACIGRKCRCKVNFNYDETEKRCKIANCSINEDCHEMDSNRYCQNGKCVCKSHTREAFTDDLCYFPEDFGTTITTEPNNITRVVDIIDNDTNRSGSILVYQDYISYLIFFLLAQLLK